MATREQVNTDSPQTLANKTLAAPIISGGAFTGPVINNGTAGADPTAPLGLSTKQYVDALRAYVNALIFSTGDVKPTFKPVADPGWVMMDDGTIGNAASGATSRANADTEALFTLLWNNVVDQWAPVSTGRGLNAAADFAANKTLALPKELGRALAVAGTGATGESGGDAQVDIGANTLQVSPNNTKWTTGMPVTFTLASGTITGLVSGTQYFVIRNSATLIQLATVLSNAQNGVAIDFTAKSAPVWTITDPLTTRALGEIGGEETHGMSFNEMVSHTHTVAIPRGNPSGNVLANVSASGDSSAGTTVKTSSSAGSTLAMNILQPTSFLNVMIKL